MLELTLRDRDVTWSDPSWFDWRGAAAGGVASVSLEASVYLPNFYVPGFTDSSFLCSAFYRFHFRYSFCFQIFRSLFYRSPNFFQGVT